MSLGLPVEKLLWGKRVYCFYGKTGFMRLWESINRYVAFKVKEAEFRVHTWRRSREISRAYDTVHARPDRVERPDRPVKPPRPERAVKPPKPVKPPRPERAVKPPKPIKPPRPERAVRPPRPVRPIGPYAAKGAKVLGIAVAAFLLVIGAVFAVQRISVSMARAAGGGAEKALIGDGMEEALQNLPEDAVLPEAAVLPEGFAENAVAALPADVSVTIEPIVEEPSAPPAPPAPVADRRIVEAFKSGIPVDISGWLMLVDKAGKVIYLMRNGGSGWEVAKSYPVATGENDGRKMVEGDKKTPEGVYFVVGRKHRSELTNIYGPAAFILDYPNDDDRRERRTGHGIWVHGSERGSIPPLFTQGCVALPNPDIIDVAGTVKNEWPGIPVIILSGEESGKKHLASVDFGRLRARQGEVVAQHNEKQAEFEALVIGWKSAWEARDIGEYSDFYFASQFTDGAMRWEAFRDRKKGLFDAYSAIHVDLSNIVLTEYTSSSATVKFNQVYNTNRNNRMENAKRLIFRKDQGQWKIYREIPFPKEELLL